MTETLARARLDEIHQLAERGVDDAYLELAIDEVLAVRIDGPDKSRAWFALRQNGTGMCRWNGRPASPDLTAFCVDLCRQINEQLTPETSGAWLIGLGDWHAGKLPTPDYMTLFICWKDHEGDIPFTVEAEARHIDMLLERRRGLIETAFKAWIRYAEQLIDADLRREHTSRIALGEAVH